VVNIDNNKCFLRIKFLISEGSCDTEDWRNDAEISALITGINYMLKYKVHPEEGFVGEMH